MNGIDDDTYQKAVNQYKVEKEKNSANVHPWLGAVSNQCRIPHAGMPKRHSYR